MRFHKSRKRYFFFQRIGSKIILAKERGKICTRYVSLPPRSFNLDSFAMPLSFRWNQNRGFYRPVSLFSSSPLPFPSPRSVLFFRRRAARKRERISIHPRTCLVIIIYKNETLGKMEACRVFHSFVPRNGRNLCHDRERERERIERDETSIQRKEAAPTRATFSLRANESFSREEFACIPLPTRKSFVLRGITYRLISFSHIFPSKTTGIIVENLSSPVVAIP